MLFGSSSTILGMSLLNYVSWILILAAAGLGSAWFNSQIEPVLDLIWIQKALLKSTSFLFGYVVAVWLAVAYIIIFGWKIAKSEGVKTQQLITTDQLLISLVGLVAIPLSIILLLIVDAI